MRLTSECGGFEAWITVDDAEQDIYQPRIIGGHDKRREGYVASVPEKEYRVCVDTTKYFEHPSRRLRSGSGMKYNDLAIVIMVDGLTVDRIAILAESGRYLYTCKGHRPDKDSIRPLMFQTAITIQALDSDITSNIARSVGLIEVLVCRVSKVGEKPRAEFGTSKVGEKLGGGVPEQAKKLLSATTRLGDALPSKASSTVFDLDWHPDDTFKHPYRKIVFRYLSEGVLKASKIMPGGAPRKQPALLCIDLLNDDEEEDRESNDTSGGDIDEGDDLEARIADLQAKTAELRLQQAQVAQRKKKKKETPEDDKENKAAIQRKAEKEAARQRKAMLERLGNSIDLTEED